MNNHLNQKINKDLIIINHRFMYFKVNLIMIYQVQEHL